MATFGYYVTKRYWIPDVGCHSTGSVADTNLPVVIGYRLDQEQNAVEPGHPDSTAWIEKHANAADVQRGRWEE